MDRSNSLYLPISLLPVRAILMLMIGYVAAQLKERLRPRIFYILLGLYVLAVIGLFIMFYPVLSGTPVSRDYVINYLRWMDSWVLVIR